MKSGTNRKKALITKAQIKFIKTVQRKKQSDALYYEMLKNRFGVDSCTELTCKQASELIGLYQSWSFCSGSTAQKKRKPVPKKPKPAPEKVVRLASVAERQKVKALAALIAWRRKGGLTSWMEKRLGIDRIRTGHDAYLVIEGLKKMFENAMKRKYGKDWWRMDFNDVHVRRYIDEHCPEEYR